MSTTKHLSVAEDPFAATPVCPPWCVTRHGLHLEEENWVHTGEPLLVADGIRAVIAMSVHPDTGTVDGPYVLIGAQEYTLGEARQVWSALLTAVEQADRTPALELPVTAAPEDMR